jgi:hypothetical protein
MRGSLVAGRNAPASVEGEELAAADPHKRRIQNSEYRIQNSEDDVGVIPTYRENPGAFLLDSGF